MLAVSFLIFEVIVQLRSMIFPNLSFVEYRLPFVHHCVLVGVYVYNNLYEYAKLNEPIHTRH